MFRKTGQLLLWLLIHFTVRAQVQAVEQQFVVAQDGSGDFKTIQEAVNAVRDHSQIRATIRIKSGTYREKLVIPAWKKNITLIGESAEHTIITNNDFSGKDFPGRDFTGNAKFSTYTSYTVLVQANDCTLQNLTIENTAGRVGQAVALATEGDRIEVFNCRILGNQDTLYTSKNGRNFFRDCLITGTTDFIFGEATAVFQNCTIHSLTNSYITAASTTSEQAFGYVFFNCKLTAAGEATKVYLGRPWRPFAKTVFIDTEMGAHIVPAGWDPWKGDNMFPEKEKTAFYAEYNSTGPGANAQARAPWTKQLTAGEREQYTIDHILSGWTPGRKLRLQPSGVPDTSFSVKGSYRQEHPRRPDIRIADAPRPASVQEIRQVPYRTTPMDKQLLIDIYKPAKKGKTRHPAVLMVHGGGWRSGDRTHNTHLARKLAAKGYVCITADYSLSTQALYPAAIHDLKAAVRWMRTNAQEYGIDTARIAIMGFSAGGELAAFIGATNGNGQFEGERGEEKPSSTVQAVVDIDGILAFIHPESGEGNDSRSVSAATYWFGYPKTERPDLWKEASPLTHVTAQTPPFLFINSSVDRMHAGREDFIQKLNAFGTYSEVRTFADAPHTFMFFDPWFEPTLATISGFLDKVLNPKSTSGKK
ncbi:pectinesterase family protein [Dyadobacter fermentans]|uniref:Pectinesterase n=1 Tax=Dyadobacter fermentans (strain ATCC 700827 / DSM 18053 / CIP 107007 / KCTC 52180 / NS114) TaxID=471854 RepID=C6VZE3_DYAFD|nr:pectinesterase family protein [Dyadobacter fermentans]ACT91755.1 Pectinesterase [Dyadobacter fermentans DSM 18053]